MKSEEQIQDRLNNAVEILPVVIQSHVKSLEEEIKILKWVLNKE